MAEGSCGTLECVAAMAGHRRRRSSAPWPAVQRLLTRSHAPSFLTNAPLLYGSKPASVSTSPGRRTGSSASDNPPLAPVCDPAALRGAGLRGGCAGTLAGWVRRRPPKILANNIALHPGLLPNAISVSCGFHRNRREGCCQETKAGSVTAVTLPAAAVRRGRSDSQASTPPARSVCRRPRNPSRTRRSSISVT